MSTDYHSILKQFWGFDHFRPLQEDIIRAVLAGKDTLALLPTGGGKSICFQVAGLAKPGLCLVVSPLIALMKDQVENLRRKSITAFAVYSGMQRKEVIHILKSASASNCRFLYVSPERLETKLFLEYLPALDVNLIAVDEAHCISQWGYDFRPPYLRIAALRTELPGVPVLALTASATAKVQDDICVKLHFRERTVFRQSFERPNLSYSVFKADVKITRLQEVLSNVPGSSIVYCKSRKRTKDIADLLRSNNLAADYYHAGLDAEERSNRQEAWISNKIRTIACTNAFGMGIDKPDVRTVVHIDAPDSLENYYQEAGRAGRDGKKAYAVLLYHQKDLEELKLLEDIRFPALPDLRTCYQAIVNYLQVPAGSGEGEYFDFDLADFLTKFKLPAQLVVNAIKVLEQENILSYNEQVFLPSKVMFTCNKALLDDFETSNPLLEPLVKTLLRTYEGIFDQPVNIHEKSLAYLLKQEEKEVRAGLHKLHAFRIISYQCQKDKPQLFFMHNRVKSADLTIDIAAYKARKNNYRERIAAFISYVTASSCRSVLIGNYFGDSGIKPCGICDNCLKQKKTPISGAEFQQLEQRILSLLGKPMHTRELAEQLRGIGREKVSRIIDFLIGEGKIHVDDRGIASLKSGG